jgi:hypothetical protein
MVIAKTQNAIFFQTESASRFQGFEFGVQSLPIQILHQGKGHRESLPAAFIGGMVFSFPTKSSEKFRCGLPSTSVIS